MDKTKIICQTIETIAVCVTISIIGGCLVSKIAEVKRSANSCIVVSNAVLKVSGEVILK